MPIKINQREKRVLLAGLAVGILIVVYYSADWYGSVRNSYREYIEARQTTALKQEKKIRTKPRLEKKFVTLDTEVKVLESGLFQGDKPPIVAARIQSLLKKMAQSIGIDITLEKALAPVDQGLYLGIPVEIGFTAPTAKLKKMLYKIKTSPSLLSITGMKVIVRNLRNPSDAQTTITVNGFIKNPAAGGNE